MVSFFSNEHLSYTGIKNIIINLSPSISIHKWLNFKRPFLAHFITTIYICVFIECPDKLLLMLGIEYNPRFLYFLLDF